MHHEYKVVVLGSGAVGKSALTIHFVTGVFYEQYDPTIEDAYRKVVEVGGRKYMLEIVDTAGAHLFQAMRDHYIRGGQGFILVYSIVSMSSFREIDAIYQQLVKVKEGAVIPMILVGNKQDLQSQREVTEDVGRSKAKKYNCGFMETSAKTSFNLRELFHKIIERLDNVFLKGENKAKKKKKKCAIL